MNANGRVFLSEGTLLGSHWFFGATVFMVDAKILFLFKDAFFLLYPSSFSTGRSSPQDIMSWLCGIEGWNCWPCNDSACEISFTSSGCWLMKEKFKHLIFHRKQLQVFGVYSLIARICFIASTAGKKQTKCSGNLSSFSLQKPLKQICTST